MTCCGRLRRENGDPEPETHRGGDDARQVRVMLMRDGYVCNRKRIQCLWRAEGLYLGQRKHRKPKTRRNPVRIQASFPNHVWAIDFQFDESADGRLVPPNQNHYRVREPRLTMAKRSHRII